MLHCHDMKKGEIYYCEECGLELKVMKECTECCGSDDCEETCKFSCCGEDLKLKEE